MLLGLLVRSSESHDLISLGLGHIEGEGKSGGRRGRRKREGGKGRRAGR